MKTIKLFIISVGLLFANQVFAQKLTIENVEVKKEAGTVKFSVKLEENTTEVAAWGAKFELPTGFSFTKKKVTLNEAMYPIDPEEEEFVHTIDVANTDGVRSLNIYANVALKAKVGVLAEIELTVPTDFTSSATIRVYEINLSDTKAVNTPVPETTFKVTREGSTGINEISIDNPADVYDLQGNKVRSKATSLEGLNKGVYIINGAKVIVK